MKANAVPLLAIFEKKLRLEVPLFQRQYVWSQSQQWEPLWEDIERKFIECLEGRKDAPVHFLGAMVLAAAASGFATHVCSSAVRLPMPDPPSTRISEVAVAGDSRSRACQPGRDRESRPQSSGP